MLKKIKTTKQMRLDELIKYIRDNRVREKTFRTDEHGNALSNALKVDEDGLIETYFPNMHLNNSFTLEVEEEINNTTIFKSVVGVLNNDEIMLTNMHTTIEGIQDRYGSMKEIYAVIDGKLQLVWERDGECVMSIRN